MRGRPVRGRGRGKELEPLAPLPVMPMTSSPPLNPTAQEPVSDYQWVLQQQKVRVAEGFLDVTIRSGTNHLYPYEPVYFLMYRQP